MRAAIKLGEEKQFNGVAKDSLDIVIKNVNMLLN